MLNKIRTFGWDESGAVTVDWVVLTAALAGLGLAVMAVVSGGVEDLSQDMDTHLTDVTLTSSFGGGAGAALELYAGDWLAPGAYDADSAWVAALSDGSITDLLTGFQQYANPDNVDLGTHNEPRNHDQYWMAYNEAVDRGLDIPENPHL